MLSATGMPLSVTIGSVSSALRKLYSLSSPAVTSRSIGSSSVMSTELK